MAGVPRAAPGAGTMEPRSLLRTAAIHLITSLHHLHLRGRVLRAAAVVFLLSTGSCRSQSASAEVLAANPYWDDLARFLSGMSLARDSRFAVQSASPVYRVHDEAMDRFWAVYEARTRHELIRFQQENITPYVESDTAIYPLSGSDFINLHNVYPNARRYVMFALQDAGGIPEPLGLSPADLNLGLTSIRGTISTLLNLNYLYSSNLGRGTNNHALPGTGPMLLAFLPRLGMRVLFVEPVGLDEDGRLVRSIELPPATRTNGTPQANVPAYKLPQTVATTDRGIRIFFARSGAWPPTPDDVRELVYLNVKIEPTTGHDNSRLTRYLRSMPRGNVLLKAAIHLCQMPGYDRTADLFLGMSSFIVQDDSGVPFRRFDRDHWDVALYGVYQSSFPNLDLPFNYQQPDLAAAYRARGRGKLAFPFGYGALFGEGKSNLLIAKRKAGAQTHLK